MIRITRVTRAVINDVDPYRILGVTPNTPFSEIRQRFYTLTQQLHPDMPHGDAVRFREVNAAYRQLRSLHRKREDAGAYKSHTRASNANSKRWDYYYSEKAQHTSNSGDNTGNTAASDGANTYDNAGQDFRWTRATDTSNGPWRHHTTRTTSNATVKQEFALSGVELVAILVSILVALLYGVQRYVTVWRLVKEKREHQRRMDEGLPPSMPEKVEEAWRLAYSTPPAAEEIHADSERLLHEAAYRRATQRRFDDFREFMFVFDPDTIGDRKVSTARFSHQYIDEAAIPKRCPLMREFDSRQRETNYDAIAKDVRTSIAEAAWWQPDVGSAGALLAQGISCVHTASPNTAKWTFIEYVDTGNDNKNTTPVCLFALRNLRYDDVGVCQRVIVSGNAQLANTRMQNANADGSGNHRTYAPLPSTNKERNVAKVLCGQPLPFKNTDTPLEKMRL